jgi:hypothetical protein
MTRENLHPSVVGCRLVMLLLTGGCAGRFNDDPSSSSTCPPRTAEYQGKCLSAAAVAKLPENRGKVIGAPCTYDDADPRTVDVERDRVPPGWLFCLGSSVYPYGYMSSNCGSDDDCPGLGICHDRLCRAPCDDDGDCILPATCSPRHFCKCDACVPAPGAWE